jgi:hypothetical protein
MAAARGNLAGGDRHDSEVDLSGRQMKEFAHEPIAKFLGCECTTSEHSSPIDPHSTTYAFRATSSQGTLVLTVDPTQGICFVDQIDAKNNEVATATVHVTELRVSVDVNEETGEDEELIVGVGPGGHICISRTKDGFTVFYSMYGDRLRHRSGASERPSNGLVPTQDVALQIAEAVLIPLYGTKRIRRQRPFKVNLAAGVWTIEGSYPEATRPTGVALVQLRQEDGQVLQVTHGQWP